MDLRGKRALITGASSGIGLCMAHQLAAQGVHVILVARREDRLKKLADELRDTHGVEATALPFDLGDATAPTQLFAQTEGQGTTVDILINNAGFARQCPFADLPWEESQQQLQVNLVALTELTYLFLQPMKERNAGHILNVSSIGAYLPTPGFALYAASKAYVRNFTEALAEELKHTHVNVCCLCPGGTKTEFMDVSGQDLGPVVSMTLMSPERCARIGLRALFRGRRNIVSGWSNSFAMFLLRFLPRRLSTWIAGKIMMN